MAAVIDGHSLTLSNIFFFLVLCVLFLRHAVAFQGLGKEFLVVKSHRKKNEDDDDEFL